MSVWKPDHEDAVPVPMGGGRRDPCAELRAERDALKAALEHYAEREHWDLLPDPRPEAIGKPYYPEFSYDGGHKEPWKVARDALALLADTEEKP